MIVFRDSSFRNGEIVVDDNLCKYCAKEYTVCIRYVLTDTEADIVGWMWLFFVCGSDEKINLYMGTNKTDLKIFKAEDLVADFDDDYFLKNGYVALVAMWSRAFTETDIKKIMSNAFIYNKDLILWLMFVGEKPVVLSGQNISVTGGEYSLGDVVDVGYNCYVVKR